MTLFDLPLRIPYQGEDVVEIDILDAAGKKVATVFGRDDPSSYGLDPVSAMARAEWFCLHANARFAQIVPADNELDEAAYMRAKDEANDE